MSPGYQLTPEQLKLQEERRRQKAEKQAAAATAAPVAQATVDYSSGPHAILTRQWLRKRPPRSSDSSVKVMNWNMLAQTLVRRELFPSSDCLKGAQRAPMLSNEILAYRPDIACLQEVDRLEKLLPPLHAHGYAHTYAAGRGKKHGCMIIYTKAKLACIHERTVYFDELDLHQGPSSLDTTETESQRRKGSSRRTKNIALIVALKKNNTTSTADDQVQGYIVATCHLFWHPQYVYERVRQGALLLQEISRFQADNNLDPVHWPVLLAGDFNSQPSEALYALFVGDPLTPAQIQSIETSRVVHASLDPSIKYVPTGGISKAAVPAEEDDDDEGGGGGGGGGEDPDRVITNARPARPEDRLLSVAELVQLFPAPSPSLSSSSSEPRVVLPLRSAYDSSFQSVLFGHSVPKVDAISRAKEGAKTFANRPRGGDTSAKEIWDSSRKGGNEPMYTSFTHYWRLTLDYIFIRDPPSISSPESSTSISSTPPKGEVIALLRSHDAENLEPGLPKQGVNASDHVALVAEIDF